MSDANRQAFEEWAEARNVETRENRRAPHPFGVFIFDRDESGAYQHGDTRRAWETWQAAAATLATVEADLALARGAMAADDARLLAAAEKVGIPWAGCDTADRLADEVFALRSQRDDGAAGAVCNGCGSSWPTYRWYAQMSAQRLYSDDPSSGWIECKGAFHTPAKPASRERPIDVIPLSKRDAEFVEAMKDATAPALKVGDRVRKVLFPQEVGTVISIDSEPGTALPVRIKFDSVHAELRYGLGEIERVDDPARGEDREAVEAARGVPDYVESAIEAFGWYAWVKGYDRLGVFPNRVEAAEALRKAVLRAMGAR